jgi:hypothetical protein
MRRTLLVLLALGIGAAACGDDASPSPFPTDAFAFSASSSLGVGEERVLVAIADPSGARLATPDVSITVTVHPEGRENATQSRPGIFMWALEGVSGLYRATFEFDAAGTWIVTVTPGDAAPLEPFPVTVYDQHPVPAVGSAAPRSETPTGDEFPLGEISSDPDPDPRFYELSVADAVANGRQSVIVFATPAFCQTAVCGPTLELVKQVAGDHPDVDFVHVEVYTNLDDASNLQLVPAVTEWGLPTEPWVFVVDGDGIVVARFEGVVTPEEIEEVLSRES